MHFKHHGNMTEDPLPPQPTASAALLSPPVSPQQLSELPDVMVFAVLLLSLLDSCSTHPTVPTVSSKI